jgi:nucleoside-diphosphate-sugar epimerase
MPIRAARTACRSVILRAFKRIGQRGRLRQLTLVKGGPAGDDLVSGLREWPAERPEQRVERRKPIGRVGDRGSQGRPQDGLTIEQDLALVGEVTKEDPLRHAHPLRRDQGGDMRVFLTGANGWVGSVVARELLDAGHEVTGLVRSNEKADALAATGITPLLGSLGDRDVLREGASTADGVIHTAFGLDISRIVELAAEDRRAIETYGEVFAGTDRPIVVTDGVLLTPSGEVFREGARPRVLPDFPRASQQTAFSLAERGVHASVFRLPRSVHGAGERHGFVPMLSAVAREKGVSAYVGDGQNLWPSVHRLDAAPVFRLALERGSRGEAYHAIAEEGVPFRLIAQAIGQQVGVPAKSLTPQEAEAHFGGLAMFVAGNVPASNERTRQALGWEPRQIGLIADTSRADYSA